MHSSIEVGQKEEPSVLGILHCTPVEVRTYQEGVSFGKCSSSVPDLWMGWGVERVRAADVVHKERRFWEKIAS